MKESSGRDPIVEVKLRTGDWEVELKTPQSRVVETISKVLSRLPENLTISAVSGSVPDNRLRNKTLRNLLVGLLDEGWFSQSRTMREVEDKLKDSGYSYAGGSVPHTLSDIAREGLLSRTGEVGGFRCQSK
jgi:hypothetical protein